MRDLRGLKICFLAGTLGQGGAERQLFYMLTALKQAGALPRVLCLTKREHWHERIESLGIRVTWVGQSHLRLQRLRKIVKELRRDPPDIFQSQHFFANIYVAAATRLLGLREIGALRSDGIGELGANHGFLGLWSLKAPRIIAANSLAGIENAVLLGAPRERMFFLSNVVDTSQFTPPSPRTGCRVRLLTVGRMVPVKRFDRFVRAVAAVGKRSSIPIEGLIVGDGPLRSELQSQADKLGLGQNKLQFCGIADETGRFYQNADVLVLTSDREGTPNVVLEAMASGIPVVATRVGGLPALIRHGETGYLVDPDDEAALTDAILDLVENRDKRVAFGQRARDFVKQNHDLPQLTTELRELYNVVLSPSQRAVPRVAEDTPSRSRGERVLIVTNVIHYRDRGQIFAYAPYALEIRSWGEIFPQLILASPCRMGVPPGDCLPLPKNVSIIAQPETGGTTFLAKLAQIAILPYSIARLCVAMRGIDAIHVRCPGNLGLLGVLIGPLFSRKRIAKFAGQWNSYDGEPWTVRQQRRLLRSRWWNAPVMVYTEEKNEPIHVVPFFTSAISSSQMARACATAMTRIDARPAHVLYAGRLSRAKNVHVLIDAVAAVMRDYETLKLTIVGEGPERRSLEERAASLEILDRVAFTGGVSPDAVFDHYEAADVLVLASETEGWPKTLTEGMAFGLICIGSERGLVKGMLGEERGLLVPPGDHDALARALRDVLRMSPQELRQMRERASKWASRFTTEGFRDSLRSTLEHHWGTPKERVLRVARVAAKSPGSRRVAVMHLTDTLEIGGAERMAVSLANSLPRGRFEPHVCTTRRSGPLADMISSDVAIFSLNRRRTLDLGAIRRLVTYIRRNNIQILHAHGSAVFVSAVASMFRPYPTVVWHIHYGRHAAEDNMGLLYRAIKGRVSRSIAVSEPLAAWATNVIGMPAERVAYIPNFSLLSPTNGASITVPGKRGSRIVCVANFLPEKDHLNLLRAMEIVVKVQPDAHLLLVGGGNNSGCEASVTAHIKRAGLESNVTLLGQRRDVSEILRAVDIGVLSSEAEGLPLALIEYGEAGLAVVVTSVGQCADVVAWGQAGIVVAPKSPSDLASGLLDLLETPTKRQQLGGKLRLRVEQHFNKQRIVERVYAMYDV